MGASKETEKYEGRNAISDDNDDTKTNNTNNNTMATSTSKDPPKKKKPVQHLLAGGTAGFVESSICHPLDTIKTRMQLRRQNTRRKIALGSLREVAGTRGKERALHRTAGSGGSDAKKSVSKGSVASDAVSKSETVRVKADVSKVKSATAAASKTSTDALHDVGWKQRLPSASPGAASVTETATKATVSTTTKATTTVTSSASASASAASPGTVVAPLGPFGTARRIIQREGPMALYKGLTAVYTGIVPKMAIRFVSFEYYRDVLGGWYGRYAGINYNTTATPGSVAASITPPAPPPSVTFLAGLLSGLTEAILIVTPAEVCKIRMQSQYHSLMDPQQKGHMKYKNVVQTAALVVKEEGIGALYKGVVPTMLRQGCNQAVNFTVYNWSKKSVLAWKRKKAEENGVVGSSEVQLDHWQSLTLGGLSGGMGPLANNPLDVVKTRMQKQVIHPGKEPKYKSLLQSCIVIAKEEGTAALWKGITPRLMRIMPGQAITFMTYEAVTAQMEKYNMFD